VCGQCLKGCVTPSAQVRIQLGLDEILPFETECYNLGTPVHCPDCLEVYCSDACRIAGLSHHHLLCSRRPPPAPSLMGTLAQLCAPYDFVGPLMIARIFSSIIHHCMLVPGEDGLRTCAFIISC
jgi:hypothetical protein